MHMNSYIAEDKSDGFFGVFAPCFSLDLKSYFSLSQSVMFSVLFDILYRQNNNLDVNHLTISFCF